MVKLTDVNGRVLLFNRDAIAQVTEAATNQAWHGVHANIKTFDGKWIEVRESVNEIQWQIEAVR